MLKDLLYLIVQAKWYYYVLLGLVDVEANFLGQYPPPLFLMCISFVD